MEQYIVTEADPKSIIAESYRMLRTNIHYSSYDKQIKTIVFTSAVMGEGKSVHIGNVAIAMAQAGQRVVLLEADLRKPKVHKYFGLFNGTGLIDIIVENVDYHEAIHPIPEVKNLDIITCGPIPPNPSELLGSDKMKSLIRSLEKEYDVILIDSPPVGCVTDAAIISTYVDGTVLVVASGETTIESAQKAKELLKNVNANIIGVILGKMKMSKKGYGSSYYYASYYGQDEDSRKGKKKKKWWFGRNRSLEA